MKISEMLTPSLIKLNLTSRDKNELFQELVQLFVENGQLADGEKAVRVLKEREAIMSTGVGNGIGIPHGKLEEAVPPLLAIGISPEGIDYNALDEKPVHIVLVILAHPNDPEQHLEILSEISRLFSLPGFNESILHAGTSQEVLDIIKSKEL